MADLDQRVRPAAPQRVQVDGVAGQVAGVDVAEYFTVGRLSIVTDRDSRVIQSREHNAQVKRWDHTLSIQPSGTGCIWTDKIVIEADRMEWFTARFSAYVYTRRHRHREAASLDTVVRRL